MRSLLEPAVLFIPFRELTPVSAISVQSALVLNLEAGFVTLGFSSSPFIEAGHAAPASRRDRWQKAKLPAPSLVGKGGEFFVLEGWLLEGDEEALFEFGLR